MHKLATLLLFPALAWAQSDSLNVQLHERAWVTVVYDSAVNTVPEPSTLALLAVVAGAAFLFANRRK